MSFPLWQRFLSRYLFPNNHLFSLLSTAKKVFDEESIECCSVKSCLSQIVNSKYTGVYNVLFQESIALQVLLFTHVNCQEDQENVCYNCKFLNNPIEKQKIMQARVIAMINLSEPLSIRQLAKAVHINECYLKKGFKEMFDCSIYDFIQNERIKKAKKILIENNTSINHIAIDLGFSNTSNFTNSFKKMTGLAPTEWLKNQK